MGQGGTGKLGDLLGIPFTVGIRFDERRPVVCWLKGTSICSRHHITVGVVHEEGVRRNGSRL